MCGIFGSSVVVAIGAVLLVGTSLIGYLWIPEIVKKAIIDEVALIDDTVQMTRFEVVPFTMNFTVRIFSITNPDVVLAGGLPVMKESGPYVYKLFQSREVLEKNDDFIKYKRHELFLFDRDSSYPNTERDLVTIINVPYHAIIQVAERLYPSLMVLLNIAMQDVFGEYNKPIITITVKELLFRGITLCNPSKSIVAYIVCGIIGDIAETAQNIAIKEDGSMVFSILDYKQQLPSEDYEVLRGTKDPADLGRIVRYADSRFFSEWPNPPEGGKSVCNQINGTDSGIFAPFVDTSKSLYAINTDICRTVELRYEFDTEFMGIPTKRFAANEWLLDNNEGCYCLNYTTGLNREDGCLLEGAMELYTCVGAFLVLSYPHFLYAHNLYRDGVIGMTPNEENHRIFIDIEPNTGTPIRGAKRAQFNIFSRIVRGIEPTQHLRTTLVPILWIDEAFDLPGEFVDELSNRLLRSLRLVDIFVPVIIAFFGIILLLGVALVIKAKYYKVETAPA